MKNFLLCCSTLAMALLCGCGAIDGDGFRGALFNGDFRAVIQEAKGKVFPAVVFIKILRKDMQRGEKIISAVVGSGVIISKQGEVLTNWHVVQKASDIRCLLYDGRAFDAEIVGSDKDTDLALIKLKLPVGEKPLPTAKIMQGRHPRDGDFVMAMGAPWGLNRSVSIGIISCSRRFLPKHSEYSLWYQTDASISPGNSGGPLINTDGYIIGINTRGIVMGGDMGFAVPAETILKVVPRLRKYKQVNWAWTGLQLQPLRDFNKNIYFDYKDGVVVSGTEQESPADKAGIKPRDRILQINGIPVTAGTEEEMPRVKRMLGLLPFNQKATLLIARDSKNISVTITPREKGRVEGDELACPRWDLTAKSINQFDNPELYFYLKKGVFIYGIQYPGNAARARLMPNDVILKIGEKPIDKLQDIKHAYDQAMKNIGKTPKVLFTILRNGLQRQTVLDFSRDYDKE